MIFPTSCLSCGQKVKGRRVVCAACAHELELYVNEESIERKAYCFEMIGAWEDIYFKGSLPTLAAILVYQFVQLNWSMPDFVFSTERAFGREVAYFLGRGYRRQGPFYGEHGLIVERRSVKDEKPYAFLKRRGVLCLDYLTLTK